MTSLKFLVMQLKNKNQQLTRYILQGGVWWFANCAPKLRGSFRSSVYSGQERSPKFAPTTCTNRYHAL